MGTAFDREQIIDLAAQAEEPSDAPEVEKFVTEYTNSSSLIDIPKYYRFLYLLAPHIDVYVELGCCYGWAVLHVLRGNQNALVRGIDIRSVLCAEAKDRPGFTFTQGKSLEPEIIDSVEDGSVDIILVDSDHTYETTKEEHRLWSPKIKPGGLMLFDDVHYSEYGCGRFWRELEGDKIDLPDLHPKSFGFGCLIV